MNRVVWHNGKLIPESEAKVSIYDSALMFGDMVFEMTRSFNGVQFKLREHLERLYTGIKILQIPLKLTIDEMEEAIYQTINANKFNDDDEHRIMIDVSRGLLGLYHEVGDIEPNVFIADFPLRWTVQSMGHLFDEGIDAVIPSQRAIPSSLLEPKIKNRSRIHYLMANMEVSNYEGENNWALLLDPDGFIAEGTGDNFFIIKDGAVITPEPRNILRGISRDYIIEMCTTLNIECIERNIEPYDVYTADEAFMTGTPFCMLPVTTLNKRQISSGKRGIIFDILLEKWSETVDIDIEKQIKSWNNVSSGGVTPYQFKKEE
jgi:branched-chain amino acid aminotransferase